jgi:hypothetical protein
MDSRHPGFKTNMEIVPCKRQCSIALGISNLVSRRKIVNLGFRYILLYCEISFESG